MLSIICCETKEMFLVKVLKLLPIISDSWHPYKILQNASFQYLYVNHCCSFINPTGAHTQTMDNVAFCEVKQQEKE
jgi:hypothetical protein